MLFINIYIFNLSYFAATENTSSWAMQPGRLMFCRIYHTALINAWITLGESCTGTCAVNRRGLLWRVEERGVWRKEEALTMSERTPLLHYRLSASVSEPELRSPSAGRSPEQQPRRPSSRRQRSGLLHLQQQQQTQKLSTFFGVVIPTLLSMFSVVVFLRIGEQKNKINLVGSYKKYKSNEIVIIIHLKYDLLNRTM